jgi:hypothetical protein
MSGPVEATLDYGPERGGIFHLVKTIEFNDGKVIREPRYFAEPFEAPEGRAKWTRAAADPGVVSIPVSAESERKYRNGSAWRKRAISSR